MNLQIFPLKPKEIGKFRIFPAITADNHEELQEFLLENQCSRNFRLTKNTSYKEYYTKEARYQVKFDLKLMIEM